jgi:hypothetical protein
MPKRWVAVFVAALALAAPASAGPPMSGSGTGAITSRTITGVRTTAGGKTFIDEVLTVSQTGALSGTSIQYVTLILRKTGRFRASGYGTFTGTAAGCGAVNDEIRFENQGEITATGPVGDGRTHSVRPAAGQPYVRVVLTAHQVGDVFTYDASYRC